MNQKKEATAFFTIAWVNSTYFAEGLPYMIVRILSSLYFTQLGVRDLYLGYLNYLGLPWNLKFLWAPLVDRWSTRKHWQVSMQVLLGVLTLGIAYLSFLAGQSGDGGGYLRSIAWIFILMALLAATNDIAIDGYYLEALPTRREQSLFSGYRVLAYRLSMVFARSGLVGLVAWGAARLSHSNTYYSWVPAFTAAGIILCCLAFFHHVMLPNVSTMQIARSLSFASFSRGFKTYLEQPKVFVVLAFVILYKLGDEILFSMVTPFLTRELRITTEQYAWIGGIVGAAGTIIGAMIGGWWIQRVGLRRALWPLSILMNVNLWLYVWLSIAKPDPATHMGCALIAIIHGIEQLAAGLGSAALLVFLLTTCSKEFRATHYAIGSAIMSIPGTLIGGQGGWIVERLGYTNLYILAFMASMPGMCLIPFVPIREEQ